MQFPTFVYLLRLLRERWPTLIVVMAVGLFSAGATYSNMNWRSEANNQRITALEANYKQLKQEGEERQRQLDKEQQLETMIRQVREDMIAGFTGTQTQINHLTDRIDRVLQQRAH
jgi:hypothetical protein